MKRIMRTAILAVLGLLTPVICAAQVAQEINGLHGVLEQLYDEMLPLCSQLIGVAQGIAGFAALWYIAARVWKHLANAEAIDFYPLLRPFAIGLCILMFPAVIGIINGIMKPTVSGTAAMVEGSNNAIKVLLKQKEEAMKKTSKWQMYVGPDGSGSREKWYKYTYGDEDEGWIEGVGNDVRFAMDKATYNFRNSIKEWMSEVLNVLFEAASLCIDTLRTFQLIILAVLGPLVFGLAVFDGFQHTLSVWLARYINIFLWLPVANIFGAVIAKIQENMIRLDIRQINDAGDTFFSSTDIGYLIFLLIGIVGYTTVPTVANYIVHAAGGGALQQKVTNTFSTSSSSAMGMAGTAAGNIANMGKHFNEGLSGQSTGKGAAGGVGNAIGHAGAYMHDKLGGNNRT
ncbi:MAG: conjugative transposon protein TraJ [Candidatus Pedobacter colombiensis]|uniref:Conjugative transposon protein TraJ n=1 Tax=Candidatus Pedobacter colombiensis TaxID=3121371 RepID=A0AAJ6BAK9_9SPHI|nr:conjugative transposon protein TraJ [Pedobacter sp.]WEK21363.1 MAG: conjugative transposon protein TraJ [Pedobacter sp.]